MGRFHGDHSVLCGVFDARQCCTCKPKTPVPPRVPEDAEVVGGKFWWFDGHWWVADIHGISSGTEQAYAAALSQAEMQRRRDVQGFTEKRAAGRAGPQQGDGAALQAAAHPIRPDGKLDQGKPKVGTHFLMEFPNAIRQVALHGERTLNEPGHTLYGWKKVPFGFKRYSDAHARHTLDTPEIGAIIDHASVTPAAYAQLVDSATAVAWNAMARLELLLQNLPKGGAAGTSVEGRDVI